MIRAQRFGTSRLKECGSDTLPGGREARRSRGLFGSAHQLRISSKACKVTATDLRISHEAQSPAWPELRFSDRAPVPVRSASRRGDHSFGETSEGPKHTVALTSFLHLFLDGWHSWQREIRVRRTTAWAHGQTGFCQEHSGQRRGQHRRDSPFQSCGGGWRAQCPCNSSAAQSLSTKSKVLRHAAAT